jgi:hypothetical protein
MAGAVPLGLALFMAPASADIAVVSNDGHTVTIDGVQQAAKPAKPDTVSLVDLAHYPPRIIATIEAPGSVVGPPMAVAVAKDESYAIVTSATKLDPADPGKVAPDDRVSVIDLRARPPKIAQQLNAGAGATAVRITPDGGLALVANRTEGTSRSSRSRIGASRRPASSISATPRPGRAASSSRATARTRW